MITNRQMSMAFSLSELTLIAGALRAVAPSGGGSTPFHLSHDLQNMLNIPSEQIEAQIRSCTLNVLRDAKESGCDSLDEAIALMERYPG